MDELGLIRQLETLLGYSLEEIPTVRFERHNQAQAAQDWGSPDRIRKNAYAIAGEGAVSGLFLRSVTDGRLVNFPFWEFSQIRHLHLDEVNLRRFSWVAELKGLTSLDLMTNKISDISGLAALEELTSLDLMNNQISDISGLATLKGLTSLNLDSNQISDISGLAALKGLTSLNLRSNKISDISGLATLKGLTSLHLIDNPISDISGLAALEGLTSLYLGSNQIRDFSGLAVLKGLTSLYLGGRRISDISGLAALKGLTSLKLSFGKISDISVLATLKGLTSLNLRGNQISDISGLAALKELTSLNLGANQISDISGLAALKELTSLDLMNNQISDISGLATLKELTSLSLGGNQISDISVLAELKRLTSLNLRSNQISDISGLAALEELTSLDLMNNQISDILVLAELKELKLVYLRDNQISEIPRWLAAERLSIRVDDVYAPDCIMLYNNPIEEPPLEIVRQGNAAILNYYDQLATQGKDYLYEAKMLIVGEGEAGKTTLAHKLHKPNCPLPHVDDRTRGISIQTHSFTCRVKGQSEGSDSRNFHLNIWDFGGQEIYHATHRFFLSKRSLYVLVADNRKDDTDFNYWLNIIELFAGNSPLIIVLNEKGDVQRSLNRASLLSRYPDSIKEIVSVNFKTHEEPDPAKAQQRIKAIHSLIGHIEHCAQNLPHIGEVVPARWVDVRQAIETDRRAYIYRHQFDEICQAQTITNREDIDTLLSYFHDLGILLHFNQPLLRDRVILQPAWATNAVYRIFDDDGIKAKAGRFSRQDCAHIWSDDHYRPMHDVLIELMKNFRLVYEIDNTGNLVAPQLLPPNTPPYDWNEAHNSHMQFRYDAFMPKGIFWQFAVTMHHYIDNHDWVWRNGMVIRRGNTWAEVTEDLNLRRISLRFCGPSIAEFRAVIVDELDRISGDYHQLQYDKMIPCQCSECQDSPDPHFFTFAALQKRQEQRKKTTIECVNSADPVPLSTLLDGFNIRAILDRVPDKKGTEPTPPDLLSTNELPTLNQIYSHLKTMPDQIDTRTRIALTQILSALPSPQFEELLFVLNPPSGIIPPGAQKTRVSELLKWVEGTGGISYQTLLTVLADLKIPFTLPETIPSQSQISIAPPPSEMMVGTVAPKAQPAMKTIKIFLASSLELKEDREQFEIFISRKNKEYIKNGIFFELVLWEDFLDAMSSTRLQDEYNRAIADCDVFVSLFYSKVGKYTKEEFSRRLEHSKRMVNH